MGVDNDGTATTEATGRQATHGERQGVFRVGSNHARLEHATVVATQDLCRFVRAESGL